MTAAERGRNRGPRGDRGLDAIRTAAWLSASASGLAEASSSLPPLSGTMAGKAATRRRRDASASRSSAVTSACLTLMGEAPCGGCNPPAPADGRRGRAR